MNIHAIASGAIGAVNPFISGQVQVSSGYTTNSDGVRVPTYEQPIIIQAQVQQLSSEDQLNVVSLNIQGITRKVYLTGRLDGLVRVKNKGGDILSLGDGTVWNIMTVMETWPDWCCALVQLQNK